MAFLWLWITLAFRGRRATKNQTKRAFHVVLAALRLRKTVSAEPIWQLLIGGKGGNGLKKTGK
jgi:hypothetical protein